MRFSKTLLPVAALAATSACSPGKAPVDPKIAKITPGIGRDSLFQLIGPRSGDDSLPNVYRKEQYLFAGEVLEILFYSPTGAKEGQGAAVPESTLTPIVLKMGWVTGTGWSHFDSVARANDIRAKVR